MPETFVADSVQAMTPARLAFLYGDLCLNTKIVAAIFGESESEAKNAISRHSIKWCHGLYGQLTRKTFMHLARTLGIDPGALDINDYKRWQAKKAILGREFFRLASENAMPWAEIDAFLEGLPAIQAEARNRVTPLRLEFLYGDLGAQISEIMLILNATERDIHFVLTEHEIERHHTYHPELNERVLNELAKRFGFKTWPQDRFARARATYCWPIVKREVRKGLIVLAEKEQLDLAVVDDFVGGIPAIAVQVEAARKAWLTQAAAAVGEEATPITDRVQTG